MTLSPAWSARLFEAGTFDGPSLEGGLTTQLTLEMGRFKRWLIGFWTLFPYNLSRSKKEYEMLVTRKNNVFSFLIGKPAAANNARTNSATKGQNLNDTNFDQLDKRITITKHEDFYKTNAINVINPLSQLNR